MEINMGKIYIFRTKSLCCTAEMNTLLEKTNLKKGKAHRYRKKHCWFPEVVVGDERNELRESNFQL